MTNRCAGFALRYVGELGWQVLLLTPGSKIPMRWKAERSRGVYDATADVDQLRAALTTNPGVNIGVACGEPSKVIVLDCDPRNGGDVSIRTLVARQGAFPRGPRARTGNGGWHLVFRYQSGIANSKNRLGPGIDVKSTGGYIVVAPSVIGPSMSGPGGAYQWDVSPFEVPPPALPSWLVTKLNPPPRPTPKFDSGISDGAVEHLAEFVAASREGERNNRLYWAACRASEAIAQRLVSESSVELVLLRAAIGVGLPTDAAVRTIRSGLKQKG